MFHLTLTNGVEKFQIAVMHGTHYGEDGLGNGYRCCTTPACDHGNTPADVQVWHDNEHTETLWSAPLSGAA